MGIGAYGCRFRRWRVAWDLCRCRGCSGRFLLVTLLCYVGLTQVIKMWLVRSNHRNFATCTLDGIRALLYRVDGLTIGRIALFTPAPMAGLRGYLQGPDNRG
jgi:hypothetical protein